MNNITEALRLAQVALESLQKTSQIVWTVESTGARITHTVPDVLKEESDRVAKVLAV